MIFERSGTYWRRFLVLIDMDLSVQWLPSLVRLIHFFKIMSQDKIERPGQRNVNTITWCWDQERCE